MLAAMRRVVLQEQSICIYTCQAYRNTEGNGGGHHSYAPTNSTTPCSFTRVRLTCRSCFFDIDLIFSGFLSCNCTAEHTVSRQRNPTA